MRFKTGRRIVWTAALVSCAGIQPMAAQDAEGRNCFRGRPLPTCRSFWITDAAGGLERGRFGRTEIYVAGDVGWMRNITNQTAVGATIGVGYSGEGFVALRPRLRRWVGPTVGLDAALGVRWTPGRIETIELLGGLSLGEWAGVVVGPTLDIGQSGLGFVAAGRASSYAGLSAYLAGAITVVVFALTFDPS